VTGAAKLILLTRRSHDLYPRLHFPFKPHFMSVMLEVQDLGYVKGNGQPILSGITFTVNEGDVVVLRGVSGAGYVRNLSHILIVPWPEHNDFVECQEIYVVEVHRAPRPLFWSCTLQGGTSSALR
jgi:ABC-type uncharacterized transport system ATPase subunit